MKRAKLKRTRPRNKLKDGRSVGHTKSVPALQRSNQSTSKDNPDRKPNNHYWLNVLNDENDLVEHPDKIPPFIPPDGERGRPTELMTPSVYKTIIDYVRLGNYPAVACRAAGISYSTLKVWLAKGQAGENQLYYEFWLDMRKADADGEIALQGQIVDQAKYDWRAGMEMLSRRWPERWARRDYKKIEIDAEYKTEIKNELATRIVNDPSTRELARRLLTGSQPVTIEYEPEDDSND